MAKRLFAWVIVLSLVFSLMPSVAAESSAAPEMSQWCDHTSHEGWTEIKEGDPLPTAEGKYFLSVDVSLSENHWEVGQNVHLCLNGHKITQTTSGKRVIYITEGKSVTLSIYDCVGTGELTGGTNATGTCVNVGRSNTFSLYGGKITGNASDSATGAVYLQKATGSEAAKSGPVFNMYGGEISGNTAKNGGAIYSPGGDEGYSNPQINIYGGKLTGNTAKTNGGAIYVTGRGKVHIENVAITGNKAGLAGSAIYAEGKDHPIYIKNTTITGNTGTSTNATGYSAAVYTCGAGTHLTLSGKVVISGNTTAAATIPDVVMQSSASDVLFVDELSAGSDVTFKTNKVTATGATEVIAIAQGGSQEGLWQSEWLTYMDATGATKSLTYGKDGFYFVEGHYHGDQKFAEWTKTDSLPQADVDGVGYYLANNVQMTAFKAANICYVKDGKTLHLCMNGKTVSRSGTATGAPFEVQSGSLYMSDCTAVYDENGYFVSGGKISGFGAGGGGGVALYVYRTDSVAEIQGVEFADNANGQTNESYGGGAIQVRKETAVPVKIVGCKFTNNQSAGGGGAVLLRDGGKLTAEKCIFTENTAIQGGAIYVTNGTLVLKDCKIIDNFANSASAMTVVGDTSNVTIQDTVITDNENSSVTGYGAVNCGNSKSVVKVTGKTVIYDNLNKDGNQQNLHLPEYAGVVYDLSGLIQGAKVGVTLQAERITAGNLYFSTTGMTAVPAGVLSDSADYKVELDEQGRLTMADALVVPPEPPHSHKLCGDDACTDHADATFKKWTETDSLPTSGSWYLADNVTLSAVTETTDDLTICLNGKTITQTAKDRVFLIATDKVLNITDCGTTGVITGGKNDYGSVVRVNGGAAFNLFAGKLTGNGPKTTDAPAAGAVVYLQMTTKSGATFNMYGGEITGNGGEKCWGGAVTNASGSSTNTVYVNIYGGKIYGNTAGTGGAIRMENASVTTIYGGEIYGNTATTSGGAIYLAKTAQLNLLGGKIYDNKAGTSGGAAISAGTNTVFTVGGNVQITGNQVGDKVNNLCLSDGQLLNLKTLEEDAKIGITAGTKAKVISTECDTDYASSFQADAPKMQIVYKEKALWIQKIPETSDHLHCVCFGVKNDVCDHANQMWIMWGDDPEEQGVLPNESGYYYLTGDVVMTSQQKTEKNQEIYLCLNGKTVTAAENERHLLITGGTVYTITDCAEQAGGLTGGNRTYGGSVNINVGATFNLFAGKIYANTAPESEGGTIYMQENTSVNPAIFNMYGGEISGNTAAIGGAIRAAGTTKADGDRSQINIYGGQIGENHSTGQGGAIYASNNTVVNLLGGTIDQNTADAEGGAIRLYTDAQLNLKGTDLTNNTSAVYGGAVFASYSEIVLEAGKLTGNTAKAGGAIMLQTKATMTMNGGEISGNADTASGGAGIYASSNTTFIMNGGEISGNKSAQRGGGIYFLRCEATLNGGEIANNESAKTGGGLNVSGANLVINKVTIKGNASNEGGGVYVNRTSTGSGNTLKYYPSTVIINDGALITGNKAPSNCGGMLIANEGVVVTMNGGQISKNESKNGAGVMTWSGSTFIMKGGKITNHKVNGSGGGMYISTGSTFKMEGGTISGNAAKSGGGAYFLRSEAILSGGSITGNRAKEEVKWTNGKETKSGGSGAGVYFAGTTVKLRGTNISSNTADGNGGGIATARSSVKKNGVTTYVPTIMTMTGGTISYNNAVNGGGVLTQTDTVFYLQGGTVTKNKTSKTGAGLYISTKSTLNMSGGRVVDNNAERSAAGIQLYKSTATITGGTITNNYAGSYGGGIHVQNAKLTMTGGALNRNKAGNDSGNIIVNGAEASATLKNLKIYDGEAKITGGVLVQSKATLHMENCEIFDNRAIAGSAAGFYVGDRSTITVINCKFFDNTATSNGGAVRMGNRNKGTFINCTFENNTAGKDGGALWLYNCTELTMENCQFLGNHTDMKGGAIACYGNIDMTDCVLENNSAKDGGGAVYSYFNTASAGGLQPGLIMKNVQVRNNSTEGVGGGMWVHKSCKVKLYDSEVTGNKSGLEGGAIWAHEDLELHNTSVTGNTSGGEGYAVFMNDAEYDGHSYFASRNRISGNVLICDNEGGDLWMGPDVVIVVGADGLGEKTRIELTMDSGVLTNRLFGAYHYEGGSQVYTVTYGDRSMTEPEYDETLVVKTQDETTETKKTGGDTWLYVGIGAFVLVLAAVVLLVLKKKKAGKPADEATKEN